MRDRLERLTAAANASAYIPPEDPTAGKVKVHMPQKIKLKKGEEFKFGGATGQPSKYPWDEWFTGELLLLERSDVDKDGNVTGEKRDFDCEVDALPGKIKAAARRRYQVVQISRRDADGKKLENGLIIRSRPMTDEEKQAEDVRRAEEREARKEKDKQDAGTNGAPPVPQNAPAAS